MRHYSAVLFAVVLLAVPWFLLNYPTEIGRFGQVFYDTVDQVATAVVHKPKTVAGLQSKYNIDVARGVAKIRILIVPGHGPDYGGAEYSNIKERHFTPVIAEYLANHLRNSGKYEVFVTRDAYDWSPVFTEYFEQNWDQIIQWQKSYKEEMIRLISLGIEPKMVSSVFHNTAPDHVAYRLYGLTKWSNENNIDVVIHVHINDYPGHRSGSPGKYSGFAIYVPSEQYENSETTHAVVDGIFSRLAKYNAISDLPGESHGIVDDAELIAIGAYNTANAPSMLIEYGYIYEPQFVNPSLRESAMKDMAYQTFLGLQDFFDPLDSAALAKTYDTLILPHVWSTEINSASSHNDIFALQTALLLEGVYPPQGKKMNDCPRTGSLGPCTKEAIREFQKKYGITGENGAVGKQTLEVLNRLHSTGPVN